MTALTGRYGFMFVFHQASSFGPRGLLYDCRINTI